MRHLTIALLQMDIQFGNPCVNQQRIVEWFAGLPEQKKKIDVVILPELWNTGYDLSQLGRFADKDGEKTRMLLSELAMKHQVYIVGGSVATLQDKGVYNTTYVFDRQGQLIHDYNKTHLFRLMNEDQYLLPGKDMKVFLLENRKAVCNICYDIRFPEGIRRAAVNGAEILFVSAQWPHPRLHHWRQLLIARAIENQMFVVACNRVGEDPDNMFCGHSMIIDPWGEIVAEGMQKEEIIIGEIDLQLVDEVRQRIPIFEDRRSDLY